MQIPDLVYNITFLKADDLGLFVTSYKNRADVLEGMDSIHTRISPEFKHCKVTKKYLDKNCTHFLDTY